MRRVVGVLVAVLVLLGCVSCTSSSGASHGGSPSASDLNDNPGTGPYQGIGLTPPQPRPSFVLTDSNGKSFSFAKTSGHPTYLFFGYTNCPDVCPLTMANIREALTKVSKAEQASTYVVFVTTDVKRDTGAVLNQWLANFTPGVSAHFVGLRGTQQQIDTAQAAAHIQLAQDDGATHSSLALLYGKDDYARVEYPSSTNQAQLMAHDLPLVAG